MCIHIYIAMHPARSAARATAARRSRAGASASRAPRAPPVLRGVHIYIHIYYTYYIYIYIYIYIYSPLAASAPPGGVPCRRPPSTPAQTPRPRQETEAQACRTLDARKTSRVGAPCASHRVAAPCPLTHPGKARDAEEQTTRVLFGDRAGSLGL